MRLYVVRHGSAKSKEEDPERSLSDRGVAEAGKIAALIKPLKVELDTVFHSGKARARGTAEIIAGALSAANGVVEREGLNPNDNVKAFSKDLAEMNNDVMICGHLPFVARLTSRLVTGDENAEILDFPACGVACLERIDKKRWTIKWAISPDVL